MFELYSLAQEFGWTISQIRAMRGHPAPDFITAEEWRVFTLIAHEAAAHRARKI
jgi:hypothetical protein